MNMKLKSFALAMAAMLGGGGVAIAQQWAPTAPPPVVSPYQLTPAPVLVSRPAPGESCCVAGCTDKGMMGAGANCCDHGCGECRDPRGLWGGVEYMFMWGKGQKLPPLVTSSQPGTPLNLAGVLGPNGVNTPDTVTIFGADRVGDQLQSAFRLTVGKWFDDEESIGVGVRLLLSDGDRTNFSPADSEAIVGRPFYNIDPLVNADDALIVRYPGFLAGTLRAATSSDMYNIDVLGRVNLDYGSNHRLDLIGGFQNTRLDSGVVVANESSLAPNMTSTFAFRDGFDARNVFNGGSLGVLYERYRGPSVISAMLKFSVGQMSETVRIVGSNTVDTGSGPITTPGGLLAQPTNIGTYHRKETGFVPEFTLNASRRLTDHLDVTVGYTIIYFNSVVLAGDQIDYTVNASQLLNGPLLGPARPTFAGFNDTDYFVHGLTLGLNFHY